MKRLIAVPLAFFLAAAPAVAAIRGAWTATSKDDNSVHLDLSTKPGNHSGTTIAVADLAGLSPEAPRANVQTPVKFELRREAGTASFEGTFKEGFGAGQFSFTPNSEYISTLRALGAGFEDTADDEDLLIYATLDVSTAFIRSMQAEGYREPADTYLQMRIFKVTPELVRELRGLGFDKIAADDLIATRIHKVTPDFIRAMRAAGFRNVTLDDLVGFRIHKVTPEFIKELRDLGYANISAEKLVEIRIHRVTPEFIRELNDAGYEGIPIDKLIEMRIHGIDAKFVNKMNGSK